MGWLENKIRQICREETRVCGCTAYGDVLDVPFDRVNKTQIPLTLTGADPDGYFVTDASGTPLVVPGGLGGRYILLARLDWTKETQDPGSGHKPHWDVTNATSGWLYSFPAIGGTPSQPVSGSRLSASPVAHARHTWQQFHWEGVLDAGDELQFFVQQCVSQGETYTDPQGTVFPIVVQAVVTLDLRRPGIQY